MVAQRIVDLDANPAAWPLSETALENLRWYLEDYISAPFGMYEDRGGQIGARLADWGRSVFDALFGSQPVPGDVQLVLRSAAPELLALPWELMVAPGHERPLALETAGISRSLPVTDAAETVPAPGGRLRVLMVISRPAGINDVGYRMIARPLADRLENVRGSVDLVVLRPPTLDALRVELAAAAAAGRPYQVVHFDGHGSADDRDGQGQGQGQLVFQQPDGGKHYVSARTFAEVVGDAGVPVVVLNACQSGAVGKELEAAVATALLSAGVGSVVAMAYAVYATAVAEFMTAFYNALFAGENASSAVTAGRRQMFENPGRPSPKGRLPLQDWIVPVHYQRREVSFPLAPAAPPADPQDQASTLGSGPQTAELDPADGVFIGCDLYFFNLEATFRTQQAVVLKGLGGIGKTELAKAFGRWWRDTGGVEQPEWVFWHSFQPGAGSPALDSVIDKIGTQRFGPGFTAQGAAARRRQVLDFLTTRRALLIWDNFDFVHSQADPAAPPLDDEQHAELRDFVARIAAHDATSILITSRTAEQWLGDLGTVTALGLVWPEAVQYADHLLTRYPAGRARQATQEFGDLMTWLDGHPLCMRVVLPCLESAEPGALLSELNGTSPARAETGTAADPVGSLDASIGYWYARLADNTRRLLPLVSLCREAADMIVLLLASGQPGVPSRFAGATAHDWMTAFEDAHRAGLLTRAFTSGDDDYFGLFMIHPALPGYLARRWRSESPADYDAARQAASRALVAASAARCGQVRRQAGSETGNRVLPYIEFTRRAVQDFLSRALAEKMWPEVGSMLRLLEIFWDAWGLEAEYDVWADRVRAALTGPAGDAPPLDRPAGRLWWEASDRQALWKRALGQDDQVERIYKMVLSAVDGQAPSPELDACLAQSYQVLGAIATSRSDLEEAREWRAKGLAVAGSAPGPPEADLTFRQRGDAAAERGDLAAASDFYRQSLASHERAVDQEGRIIDCLQLGSVAMKAGRHEDAEAWYGRAFLIAQEENQRRDMALALTGLGTAAAARGAWDKSEEYFRRSVAVAGDLGSPPVMMRMNFQMLGSLARRSGRLAEADGWFRRLLLIDEPARNSPQLGARYVDLAEIAKDDGRLTDAVDWYEKARELYRDLGDEQKAAELQSELDRVRAATGARPGRAGATPAGASARTGPLWAALWHPVGLRGAEFLDPQATQRGQADIAIWVAATDPDRAERIAESMTSQGWRLEALKGIAIALAARDAERAERTARSLPEGSPRARGLAGVGGMVAVTDPGRSVRLAAEAEEVAWTQLDGYPQAEVLVAVAAAFAARDPDRAEHIAQTLPATGQARALANIAAAVAATDPGRAARLTDAAELCARSIEDESWREESLAGIAGALADTNPDRAEHIAQSITQEESFLASKAEAQSAVAMTLAPADPGRAERIARSITHEYLRDRSLAAVAIALVPGDPDRAARIARSIGHDGWRTELLSLLE